MLNRLQPDSYHKKAKIELQQIKHNLKLLHHLVQQLNSLSDNISKTQYQLTIDKTDKLKFQIRDKLKSLGNNLDEMISALDYKLIVICKEITKLQKNNGNVTKKNSQKKINISQQQHKYQINQLQQRIFNLQKKQNQYVKQLSELKQKNSKLRQDFSNLSFDSNQRIKQLSQKLHNNTSPNLTIRRINTNNPQTSYITSQEDLQKRKKHNNFVKIKGANNLEPENNQFQRSPPDYKNNRNLLDSLTSQSNSQYDIKPFHVQHTENDNNLKFGCFPGKQISQKTKTGSSSQNKRLKLEQKYDKNRRFEFLLNNLIENKETSPQPDPFQFHTIPNNSNPYKYQNKGYGQQQHKSVFDQNAIKKYQI